MKSKIRNNLYNVFKRISVSILTFFIVLGVGTFSPIEAASERATLSSLEDALDITLTKKLIIAAGIEDENFANIIYREISYHCSDEEDDSNFCTYNDMLNHTYTPLSTDDIINSARSEGLLKDDSTDADKAKVILSYYSGKIDASKRKIKSIKGIKILRRALEINLENNEIEDIMELDVGKNFIVDNADPNYYFGHPYKNTTLSLASNPIHSFPKNCDGRLVIKVSETSSLDLGTISLNIPYEPNNGKGVSTGYIDLNVHQDGEPIKLFENVSFQPELATSGVLENDYNKEYLGKIKIDNIKRSEKARYRFANADTMYYKVVTEDSGIVNPSSTNLKFIGHVETSIYTKATVSSETKGSVKVQKVDNRTEKELEGAKFAIYKKGEDESYIQERTTDENGICIFDDLDPGTYNIKEIEAPQGYLLDDEVREVTIGAGSIDLINKKTGKKSSTGDSLNVYDGETSSIMKLDNGIFAKGGDNADYDLVINDNDNTILDYIEVNYSDAIKENENDSSYRAKTVRYYLREGDADSIFEKYYDNAETLEKDLLEDVKYALNEEYRNVSLKGVFRNRKSDEILNSNVFRNTRKEGKLSIEKHVSAEDLKDEGFVDYNKLFDFKLSLKDTNEKDLTEEFDYTKTDTNGNQTSGKIKFGDTFQLKNNEKIEIIHIPENTEYKVIESKDKDYVTSGIITDTDSDGIEDKKNVNELYFSGNIKYNHSVNVKVFNKYRTYKLRVYKEDSNKQGIEGTTFTLYSSANQGEGKEIPNYKGYYYSTQKSIVTKFDGESNRAQVEFEQLQAGKKYYLVETRAPTGYQINKTIYTVSVTEDGIIKINDLDASRVENTENVFSITITDMLNIKLPKTGNHTKSIFIIFGVSIMVISILSAVILLIYNKRSII